MTKPLNGLSPIHAGILLERCKAYMADRHARITAEREAMIAVEMTEWRWSWRRFARVPRSPTREQAIAKLKRNCGHLGSPWHDVEDVGLFIANDVAELYFAVLQEDPLTPMQISTRLAAILNPARTEA